MSTTTDIRALNAIALAIWQGITPAQRAALRRARPHGLGLRLTWSTNARVISALVVRGLVTAEKSMHTSRVFYPVTVAGLLVLEVGQAHEAKQAKRKYAQRGES